MQRERITYLRFYPINDNFGCFIEYNHRNDLRFVSLVEFDFADKIFRKIQTFQLNDSFNGRIFIDEFDSSKFILIWRNNGALHIQSFRLLNGAVKLENMVQYADIEFLIDHYFNGCVYECYVLKNTWDSVS
jgi:hypothetical protein